MSFKDKITSKIYAGEKISRMEENLIKKARRRLEWLNAATRLEDLFFPPSNRLHAIQGFKPTRYAIRIDKQWRITFAWNEGNAYEVCFEDYH